MMDLSDMNVYKSWKYMCMAENVEAENISDKEWSHDSLLYIFFYHLVAIQVSVQYQWSVRELQMFASQVIACIDSSNVYSIENEIFHKVSFNS